MSVVINVDLDHLLMLVKQQKMKNGPKNVVGCISLLLSPSSSSSGGTKTGEFLYRDPCSVLVLEIVFSFKKEFSASLGRVLRGR